MRHAVVIQIRNKEKYVYLHLFSGQRYIVDFTLEQLENRLDTSTFYRVSRNCIAQIQSIQKVSKYSLRVATDLLSTTALALLASTLINYGAGEAATLQEAFRDSILVVSWNILVILQLEMEKEKPTSLPKSSPTSTAR